MLEHKSTWVAKDPLTLSGIVFLSCLKWGLIVVQLVTSYLLSDFSSGKAVGSSTILVGSCERLSVALLRLKNAWMFFQKIRMPTPMPNTAARIIWMTSYQNLGRDTRDEQVNIENKWVIV